jgi:predicted dehydrogenase
VTVRAALIGAGSRAPAHIEAYRRVPGAEVVAVCDRSGRGGADLAGRYGLRAYRDVRAMLDTERPDIVHIVTGPRGRVELMERVAEAKVPLCTVEKPLLEGATGLERIEALNAHSDTHFAACHQFRWQPDYARVREAARRGAVGEVLLVDMSAGMSVAGQGTHVLHYGMELNGAVPVTEVFGTAEGWSDEDPDHAGPLATEAALRFANGSRGLWLTGRMAPRVGGSDTVWQHVRVAAHGTRGRAWWEEFGTFGAPGVPVGHFGGMDAWRAGNLEAQAGLYRAMLHWRDHPEDPPSTNLDRALHEWRVVLALYESALTRRAVLLEGYRPPPGLMDELRRTLSA